MDELLYARAFEIREGYRSAGNGSGGDCARGGVSEQKVEETRSALRELGLNDMLDKDF